MDIKLGLTAGISPDIKESVEFAIKNNFKVLEIAVDFYKLDKETIESLKKQDLEYTIHLPYLDIDISDLDDEKRKFSIKKNLKAIELAEELKVSLVVSHGAEIKNYDPSEKEQARKNLIESMNILSKICKEKNIVFCAENMVNIVPIFKETEEILKILQQCSNVKLTVDIDHIWSITKDIEKTLEFLEKCKDYIFHIHIEDSSKNNRNAIIGEGDVDFTRILKFLKSIDYKGVYIIEISPKFKKEGFLKSKEKLLKIAQDI